VAPSCASSWSQALAAVIGCIEASSKTCARRSLVGNFQLKSPVSDARRPSMWTDLLYAAGRADNLNHICFPAPGMSIGVLCARTLTDQLVRALTDGWQAYHSLAHGYHDLLNTTINDTAVNTSCPYQQ
jgi:hypothetical protein